MKEWGFDAGRAIAEASYEETVATGNRRNGSLYSCPKSDRSLFSRRLSAKSP
jgi:hypothetical protein